MAALPTVVVLPTAVLPVAPAAVVVVPAAVPLSSLSAFANRRFVVSTGVVVGVVVPTVVAVPVVVPPVVPPVAVVATSHPFCTVVWRPSVDRIHAALPCQMHCTHRSRAIHVDCIAPTLFFDFAAPATDTSFTNGQC